MSHEGDPRYLQTTPYFQTIADQIEAVARMLAAKQDDVPVETAWPYYIGDAKELRDSAVVAWMRADAWDEGFLAYRDAVDGGRLPSTVSNPYRGTASSDASTERP